MKLINKRGENTGKPGQQDPRTEQVLLFLLPSFGGKQQRIWNKDTQRRCKAASISGIWNRFAGGKALPKFFKTKWIHV